MTRLSSVLPSSLPSKTTLVTFVFEKASQASAFPEANAAVKEALKQAQNDGFEGKTNQIAVTHPSKGRLARVFFVGLGKEKEATPETLRRAAGAVCRRAVELRLFHLYLRPPQLAPAPLVAQAVAEGILLGQYRYKKYQTQEQNLASLNDVFLIARDQAENRLFSEGLRYGRVFADATNLARDLINQPPSDTTPLDLTQFVKSSLKGGVKIKVFSKIQLRKMGMRALLGVNRGSAHPPAFVHLIYKPKTKIKRKIGICGKGITFDSGGLSLKPSASMETMKYDMAGAATVFAIFKALTILKPPVEIHGFTPLTENMPGPNAVKPGDVLKTFRGKTIEVLNTDAEGRLVLSDALSYACRQGLDEILDIATLTGACVIALGKGIAGLMGTNQPLLERLKAAAKAAGEKLWELPLEPEYENLLKSPIADIKNIGPVGEAGTILGGLFLKAFVDDGVPWAHIDIASTGWTSSQTALSDVGATGIMVRTLLYYILSYN